MSVELLVLAAKAAGYTYHPNWWDETKWASSIAVTAGALHVSQWNPLKNDGDAFRLACALGIDIFPWCDKTHDQHDICGAARRRIVEAAAEIGRAMP